MTTETIAIIAVVFAGLTFLSNIVKDIFGGSAKLAQNFHVLDKSTSQSIQSLRDEFLSKVLSASDNSRVGFDAITANIHALQLAHAEFRAKMSDEYIRWRDFQDVKSELKRQFEEKHNDLKSDMHEGFTRLEKTLDDLSMSIESARRERERATA